ncbi:MAG: hypothetical protein L0211_22980 [Planctomycetaceae bacterium]|nr:hypothetical protein [Planctomycetaceae bacterium]
MVKQGTKKPRKLAKSDRFPLIGKELHKRTKAELAAIILEIAKEHDVVARELEDRLPIEKPADRLVADLSSAIDRATRFDKRLVNCNFDVDWQAYADVQKGLSRLVEMGHLADAKPLALKLMKDGSYQVEFSDEGLMAYEIGHCLEPVIRAVKAAGGVEAVRWARAMQAADRVGFICDKELAALRGRS